MKIKVQIKLLVLCSFIFLNYHYLLAQLNIEGIIKETQNKSPIPYCAIGIKNKANGCLTNEQGVFLLKTDPNDTLLINCIGYKKKMISVAEIIKTNTVYLDLSETVLQEVEVYSDNNYLYAIVEESRKKLKTEKSLQSKVYFLLETEIDRQAVELVECYYNGEFNLNRINTLNFKNGRIGIAPYRDRFFVSLNSSKAFTFLDLLYANEHMPDNPYQFGLKQLKQHFQLTLINTYDSVQPVYQIQFKPLKNQYSTFTGELHIQKNNFQLVKIVLEIVHTQQHPFLPLFPNAKIRDVSMQITKTFETKKEELRLHHMDFNYQMNYQVQDSLRVIRSKGLMFFYDYNLPFIPPYYQYNSETDDYRKITSLTYNDAFWETNTGLVYSDKMKLGLSYFSRNGVLLNYRNDGNLKQGLLKNSFFENNYLLWTDKKRIRLKPDGIKNDTLQATNGEQQFIADRYRLNAQIFLDVNPMGDSLQHYSVSIFNVFESFYNLKEEKYTNCFINIYFDLVEIERRKMETEIRKNKGSLSHIEACYKAAKANLELQTNIYLKEVERGRNLKKLEKWNALVNENLLFNNMQMFQLR